MSILTAPTPKQQARALIERLPDTATWDDVAQTLAVEEGLADVRAGRVVDGEQLMRWLESWGHRARVAAAASLNGGAALHGARAR